MENEIGYVDNKYSNFLRTIGKIEKQARKNNWIYFSSETISQIDDETMTKKHKKLFLSLTTIRELASEIKHYFLSEEQLKIRADKENNEIDRQEFIDEYQEEKLCIEKIQEVLENDDEKRLCMKKIKEAFIENELKKERIYLEAKRKRKNETTAGAYPWLTFRVT